MILTLLTTLALARPPGPRVFCETYPDAPVCTSGTVGCEFCHTSPPDFGPFGADIAAAMPTITDDQAYTDALPDALRTVEPLDSDGDGKSNLSEITWGTPPGNAVDTLGCTTPVPSGPYTLCAYDPVLAFRRVSVDVCGRSPSRAELDAVREDPTVDRVLDRLDACLQSDHWRGVDGVLWQIAFPKVRPREPFQGSIARVYEQDLNLFTYTQIDDHDARDLLVADYQVQRTDGSPPTYTARPFTGPRSPDPETRAGMLTTTWFHSSNTMGQALPRVTAAQAYRAYLGYDLAVPEGIFPALDDSGQPIPVVDYDDKGVDAPLCASCHSTLDPLAYMFSRYAGAGENVTFAEEGGPPASFYWPERMDAYVGFDGGEALRDVPETGAFLGESGYTLVEWSQAAATSEDFARALVRDYWIRFIGHEPTPAEALEFESIWRGFMTEDDYRTERMLRALVQTEAYGVP